MNKGAIEIDIYEVWRIIKKNIKLIIVACFLCGTMGFVLAKTFIPKKYEAISKIIVVKNETESSNSVTYNDLQTSQKLAETYRQIIMSEAISDKVIYSLGLKNKYDISTAEYNKMVSVYTENNTEVLAIKVSSKNPELSANIANEIVKVFISNIYTIYGVQNVSILNRAKIPETYSSPSIVKYTLIGIITGSFLSLIFIVIKYLIESKVKSEEDIKEIFGFPIIANIPEYTTINSNEVYEEIEKDPTNAFVTKNHPESIVAEAYRTLRTNLSLRDYDDILKIINVISPTQQEGKSSCVLNLGYVYSQLKKKVLIIDLDLRLPSLHEKLNLTNKCGVTDVVSKHLSFNEAKINYDTNLDILLSGSKTVYTSELIQSNAFKNLLNDLKKKYDIILIDCPPLNMVADCMITSTLADGTIICVAESHDERGALIKTRDTMKQLNINVLGVVVTMTKTSRKKYDGRYGYGYGYGYGYSNSFNHKYKYRKICGYCKKVIRAIYDNEKK